ncbi:MAG TPA: glycosyltransferase family 4 protein [Gaiellaceae bacterium]|nr:glycosyltransferase family 4 protein [Gaiellaceae bacterium]
MLSQRHPVPILFVHHRSELGGAPESLSYVIRELDRTRFEPHVYCPSGPAAELFREAGAIVHTGAVAGFTHIWASTYRGRRWLLFARELARLPSHVHEFRQTLRHNRFELVHFNDSPLIPAAWLARREGLPLVWHLRSALPGEGHDRRSALVRRAIRRLATKAIAINRDVAEVFDVDAVVVPNSVDLERFHPSDRGAARDALDLPAGLPVVSFFGFIYPSKGFREFIEAAARLRARGVEASYLVVGGAVRGQEFFRTVVGRSLQLADLTRDFESEAKDLVRELELSDVVRFIPFTQDTANLYQASDVVVAPSQGPELGRPVIEAAASGVPVVASGSRSGGGVVIPGETGVLVSDYGVESIADAVAELLEDPARRSQLGRAARIHAEENFDPGKNARRIEAIYHEILPSFERIPILYVHHRPQLGGAPSSLAQLIRHLDPRFEPHVYCPEGPAAELFANAGATVHTGDVSIFAHAWDSPYEGLRWLVLSREVASLRPHLHQLDRLMREHRFPLVHLNDSPLLAAAYVARKNGAKIVWHLRSALAGEGLDRRSRMITWFMGRYGDAAIAIDRDVAARFPIQLPLEIVHNSVREPTPVAEGGKAAIGLPEDRVAIGFAGFVRRQKGWQELVSAAEILVRENVPAHFVIMGGGVRPPEYFKTPRGRALELMNLLVDEESAIKQLVAEKHLEDHFSFLPFTAETGEIYNALDIVTFPNQGIGLGRPVLEAAMYGKPVVASGSIDGAGVLLPGKTGLLLEDANPEELASALRVLTEDPELRRRLGAAAAEHAREKFDPARNARVVEALYDRLLGIAPSAPAEEAAAIAA